MTLQELCLNEVAKKDDVESSNDFSLFFSEVDDHFEFISNILNTIYSH